MKTARGLLYLLAVSVLMVAVAAIQGSEEHSICTVQCCQVLPNCSQARRLACDCRDRTVIIVGEGDIPPTIQTIDISGTSNVVIQENAIYDLPSLTLLRFKDIGNMEVQPDGLKMQPGAKLFSINVKNVGSLELQSYALSGSWNSDVKIRMQNVARLHIRAEAFSFNSTTHGPHVSLEQINLLNLAPHGFASPISQITVMHAHMATCDTASFGNNFGKIEFKKVTIDEAKSGCVHITGIEKSVSFHSCQVDIVESLAFTGQMHQMIFEDSNFTIVHGNGLQICVSDLQITNSRFRDLGSNAMNVTAKHSISLTRINVEMLKKNALMGLHVEPGSSREALIIRSLRILHAEDGSLKLSKRCNLRLYDLNVDPPNPPMCPIAKWARHLTGQRETETLTRQGDMVFKQINRQKLCTFASNAHLINNSDQQRLVKTSSSDLKDSNVGYFDSELRDQPSDDDSSPAVLNIIMYCTLGVALFVLVSAAAVALYWSRNNRKPKLRSHLNSSNPAYEMHEQDDHERSDVIRDDEPGGRLMGSPDPHQVASPHVELPMPSFAEGDSVPSQLRRRRVPGQSDEVANPALQETPVESKSIDEIFNSY